MYINELCLLFFVFVVYLIIRFFTHEQSITLRGVTMMKKLKNFTLDGCITRINETDLATWWMLQQFFAYPPFNEFFDTDKLIDYFNEFANGGINHMEIEIQKGMWVPVALMSWHPMVEGDHPVHFPDPKRVAYISDSITCLGYQKKGVQKQLFAYTLEDMKNRNFSSVYLRTSRQSSMYYLARKMGFEQISDITQTVSSMRVGGVVGSDERIFFYRSL